MAIRKITSPAKPSTRLPGWYYAYYNKPTPNGGECVVIFSPAIADVVQPGFPFDDSCVTYDEELKASVLNVDFDEPANLDGTSLPPDPEAGWGDPDYPAAAPPVKQPEDGPAFPPGRAGHRPATVRRHEGTRNAIDGAQLPAAFLRINLEVSKAFLLQYRLLSSAVGEARRADVAQKLTAIAAIPYYRQMGVELTEDDVKGMAH